MFGLWLLFDYIATVLLIAPMEGNSKNDALSQKTIFSQLSYKTPIECQLCNRKLKSKSGYTLHVKKCSDITELFAG